MIQQIQAYPVAHTSKKYYSIVEIYFSSTHPIAVNPLCHIHNMFSTIFIFMFSGSCNINNYALSNKECIN